MLRPLSRLASSNRTGWISAILAAVLLCVLHAPLSAEWYKDYENAMDLIKKGQNASAIPLLQSAISQKGEEGSNIKFYGMKFGDYFPHYYLGMAYFSQKNYTGAVQEFETSERFGAIQRKKDLYQKMSSVRTLAKAQLVVQKEPDVASTTPPVIPTPIVTPPVETKKEEKKEEPVKVTELQVQKPSTTTTTPAPSTTTPKEQKPPPVVIPPVDGGVEAVKVMVKNGARKYFEGDYDGAISYLNGALEVNSREAAAQFLLGCAYASKYLMSGSENQNLLKDASAAFQKLKKLNPKYQPRNKTYFSPAVLELYAKT